jgi:DNA-binding response OmpR family regulator
MPDSIALRAARAAGEVCHRLGLDEDVEAAVALAVVIAAQPQPIERLTEAQTRIVRVLEAAHGRCVTLGQLIEASGAADSSAIVHLTRIRQRRPDIGARIETVWGKGYRWRP